MSLSHKRRNLSLSKSLIHADSVNTCALFHFDITENEVLRGIEPISPSVFTLRRYEGKFGGGIAVEESTQNLWANVNGRPQALTAAGTTPPTVQLVSVETPFGTEAWKVTIPSGNATGFSGCRVTTNGSTTSIVADGRSYSYFTYVYFPDGDPSGITIYPTGQWGMASCNRNQARDMGSWFFFGNTYSSTAGYSGNNYMAYYANTVFNSPKVFYIGAIQIEEKPFSTSFVNGNRSTGILKYSADFISPQQGTISFWYKPSYPSSYVTAQVDSPKLIQVGEYYANSSFTIWNMVNKLNVYVKGATSSGWSGSISINQPFLQNVWTMITVTWNGASWKVYRDGKLCGSFTATESLGFINGNCIYIGGDGGDGGTGSGKVCNGIIDELRIDSVARTDEEIESWYVSGLPFYPKGVYRLVY